MKHATAFQDMCLRGRFFSIAVGWTLLINGGWAAPSVQAIKTEYKARMKKTNKKKTTMILKVVQKMP